MVKCRICGEEIREQAYGGHVSGHARNGDIKVKEYINCKYCGKPLNNKYKTFCDSKCFNKYQKEQWINKWLSGEISGFSATDHWGNIPDRIRNYLFEKYDNKCSKCGWSEVNQFTGRIPLEVEHIDGDYKNNRPENLTLLCPNCHSLTEHYRGANRGSGRRKTWTPINDGDQHA